MRRLIHSLLLPLNTLDRYLLGQLLQNMIFALMLFSIIWLAPETLFKLTQYVFGGNITLGQAGVMFFYHLPGVLQQSIPVSVLLGSLFAFQRLSHQFELVSFFASGVSPARILKPVLIAGGLFALLHFGVQELVTPWSAPKLEQAYLGAKLKDKKDRNFVFVEKNRAGQLEKFFMIGQAQKDQLLDFIVLYYEPDTRNEGIRISRILRAQTGYWMSENRQWKLVDGVEYFLNEEGVYQDSRLFKAQQVRMSPYSAKLLQYSTSNPKDFSLPRLWRYIRLLEEGGQLQDVPFFQVRLYQKFSAPLAAVFFAVIGALLGMERVRAHRSYGLLFGAVLVFVYSVLTPFSGNIANFGLLPIAVIAWLPLVVSLGVAWGILKLKARL